MPYQVMLHHMPDKFPFYCTTETALPLIIWSVPPPLHLSLSLLSLSLLSLSLSSNFIRCLRRDLSLSLRVTSLEQVVVCHTASELAIYN